MTLLETLQAHRGGLLRIKSELYWYGGRGWDGTPDRICLLLDADDDLAAVAAATSARRGARLAAAARRTAAVLLLIDGCPQRVWVSQEDVEIL